MLDCVVLVVIYLDFTRLPRRNEEGENPARLSHCLAHVPCTLEQQPYDGASNSGGNNVNSLGTTDRPP